MAPDTFQVSAEVVQALLHAAEALILGDIPVWHHKPILALLVFVLLIVQVIVLHESAIRRLGHAH